jgi:hypothetical protein
MFNDFMGVCGYIEYDVGAGIGISGTALMFGIPTHPHWDSSPTILPEPLPPTLVKPRLPTGFLEQANGLILFSGNNVSVGVSVSEVIGYIIPLDVTR